MDDYDVEDDLPQNVTTPAAVARITKKQLKDQKLKEDQEAGKAIRKPRPKLDFNRLLKGSRGLGYLAVCTKKSLKLSGKPGAEANDLSQISVYLQEWAKLVFPKMPLMEFLLKVEDICQSRLMKACVPQILARIKEMGEDVDLGDLEQVQSEIMAKIAANDAEQAMGNISAGPESQPTVPSIKTDLDFDLDENLALNRANSYKRPWTEGADTLGTSAEELSEDEGDYEKEMRGFINDHDSSEKELSDDESLISNINKDRSSDTEVADSKKAKKRITFNFESDEAEAEDSNVVVEEAVVKRKSVAVIMDSDDE